MKATNGKILNKWKEKFRSRNQEKEKSFSETMTRFLTLKAVDFHIYIFFSFFLTIGCGVRHDQFFEQNSGSDKVGPGNLTDVAKPCPAMSATQYQDVSFPKDCLVPSILFICENTFCIIAKKIHFVLYF